MRCHICDANLEKPVFNRDMEAWEPCITCMDIITDTLGTFKDQVIWVEEDLPSDMLVLSDP